MFDDDESDEDAVDHEQMEHQLEAELERNAVIEKLKEPQSYLREEMLGGWLLEGAVDWYAEHNGPSSTPVRILEELRGELDWLNCAIKAAGDLKPPIDPLLISEAEKLLNDVEVALTTALNEMFQTWAPDGKIEESQRAECSDLFEAAFALRDYTTGFFDLEPLKAQFQSRALFEHVTCFLRNKMLGGWLREGAVDWYGEHDGPSSKPVRILKKLLGELQKGEAAIADENKLVWPVGDSLELKALREQVKAALPTMLVELCDAWAPNGKIIEGATSFDFDDSAPLFEAAIEVANYLGVSVSSLRSLQEQNRLRKQLKQVSEEQKRLRDEHTAKDAELEAGRQFKRSRESVEAAMPEGTQWTIAESYVLIPSDETRVDVVGEQYEVPEVMDGTIFRVEKASGSKSKVMLSLCLHDPNRGYRTDPEAIDQALAPLLTAVRQVVKAVDMDEDDECLDSAMKANLKKKNTIASKITSVQLTEALSTHLARDNANVLSLDAKPGILNMVGAKVASYDSTSGLLSLVDRDANAHHVHRSSGVDCAWLAEELSPEKQAQFHTFVSTKLNRWIIDAQAREYVLCATGAALFGGDTTSIKSSLLLIGAPDQAKSTLLDTLVSAGGWEEKKEGSAFYSYGGADPNALLAKSSKDALRNAMLADCDGTRLCKFNELEGKDVWHGVKSLANMEAQRVTYKKQSDGSTSTRRFETPYVILSCNAEKRPHKPPDDVKTKVAVLVPEMLGRFVDSDTDVDVESTFKKDARLDSSNDAGPMLRAMWLALRVHAEARPGDPFDHERHMPACMHTARGKPATWSRGGGSGGAGPSGASGSSDDGYLVRATPLEPRVRKHAAQPARLRCSVGGARRGAQAAVGARRAEPGPPHLPALLLRAHRVARARRVGALRHRRAACDRHQGSEAAAAGLPPHTRHRLGLE